MDTVVEVSMDTETREEMISECPICRRQAGYEFLVSSDRFHGRRQLYRLLRCHECGLVWLASPPRPQDMAIHYSENYHRAIAAAGEGLADRRWKRQREMISRLKDSGVLLDIGCSTGGFLSTMSGNAWRLCGIEMEESTARKARAATGADVFVGDAVNAPFPPSSFDVITSFDVLEHVYSPRQFLMKVHQWLKPGGIFYAMVPNIDSWESRLFRSYWYGLELPRHLFHFSPRSLRYLMNDLRLDEVTLTTPPISYVESSVGYVTSSFLAKLGFSLLPLAEQRRRTVLRKAVWKAIGIAAAIPFAQAACFAGAGPSLEVIFSKQNGDARD
jgi:SAM-dependent methyltransferase